MGTRLLKQKYCKKKRNKEGIQYPWMVGSLGKEIEGYKIFSAKDMLCQAYQ